MGHAYNGEERRKDLRSSKSYSLFFYFKDSPGKKSDASFIKDIGKGGVRFTTSRPLKTGDHLIFEMGIPYIAPKKLILEGSIVSIKEIMPRLVYEIRAKFDQVDEQTELIFDLIEKQKSKGL